MRRAGIVFVVVLAVYLLGASAHLDSIDEYNIFFQADNLVTEGSLTVPKAKEYGVWYGRFDKKDQPRAPYGPAHAMALAPWVKFGTVVARKLQQPAEGKDFVTYGVACASNAFFGALLVALFFALSRRLGASGNGAVLAALALAFATPLWAYAGTLYSEVFAALLLLGALAFLMRATAAEEVRLGMVALSGALVGVAILTRMTHVVAAPVFGLAFLFARGSSRRRLGAFFLFGAISAAFLGVYLLLNRLWFGEAFQLGYPDHVEGGRMHATFDHPFFAGLRGLCLDRGKSVLLFAPPLILAAVGWAALVRRSIPVAIVSLVCPAAYLALFARHSHWEGGYAWGPRYLLPVLPFALLGLAPLLSGKRPLFHWLLWVLFIAGAAVQVPAVVTSYFEPIAKPGSYYDQDYVYIANTNAIGAQWKTARGAVRDALDGKGFEGEPNQGLDVWVATLRKVPRPVPWRTLIVPWLGLLAVAVAGSLAMLFALARREEEGKGSAPG